MSFWTYLKPSDAGPPDEATIGSLLRDLHAVLRDYPAPLPPLAPLADIPAFLARRRSSRASQTVVSADDAAILAETYRRLTEELAAAAAGTPVQALHGDAGAGNLMATGGQWIWHDFEDACSGPVAWDLAATTASPRFDRARILSSYADRATGRPGRPGAAARLRTAPPAAPDDLVLPLRRAAARLPPAGGRAAGELADALVGRRRRHDQAAGLAVASSLPAVSKMSARRTRPGGPA